MKNFIFKLVDLYFLISDFVSQPVHYDNIFVRYFMMSIKLIIILTYVVIILSLLLLFALLITFIVSYIEKQFSYNIDSMTCEPKGIYSNYQLYYNPQEFYSNRINSIEETLREWTSSSIKSHCISGSDDCVERMNKYNQELSLCLSKYKKNYRNLKQLQDKE